MFWFQFVLVLIILLITNFQYAASSSSSANTTTTITIYVSNLIGQDSITCQNRTNPCKTLHYAWQKMFEINSTTTDSVTFSLSPSLDVYEPTTTNNQASYSSLFFNCGKNRIKDIHIQAADNVTVVTRYKHDKNIRLYGQLILTLPH